MPFIEDSIQVRASIEANVSKAVTGFQNVTQAPELDVSYTPDTAVYQHALIAQYTLAAAATQVIDLYSLVSDVDGAVTITKFRGVLIEATASITGGQVRIERDATNGWAGLFDDATDKFTMSVGTEGCAFMWLNGATVVVSNTSKRVLLTNPGSQSVTVRVYFILGT